MSHSNHSSTGQIKTLLKESSWITCKVKETEIMMRKLSIKECESSVTEPFERLNFTDIAIPEKKETQNEKSSVSFTFPLGVDEELCCEEEEKNEKKNYNPKDWIIVSLVSNDYSDTVNKNKYRNVVTLFINHILNSEKKDTSFRYKSISFRKAIIFGIIVGKSGLAKGKNITVDDGTGQLTCKFRNVNKVICCTKKSAIQSEQMNEAILLIRSKWQQIRKKLITFEELNIGNRICACGDISFYKDNFYMFVDNLRRYEGVEGNIIFMKKVFHLTQNCESFPTQPCEGPLTDSFGLNFEEIDQLEKGFLRKENSSATSTVPLEVDEELYCQKEQDNEKDNEDPKDWITAPLPFNDDDFIERDNINIVTLFINHILNSAKESTFLDSEISHLERQSFLG